ncbi:MAG: DUF2088 domain-containing protein [Candidatus Bathyarchaeota archaeon]|nr:MAG: DUF2088 domain-containing protein [Candidatus Bathyarchaeota archaeon]
MVKVSLPYGKCTIDLEIPAKNLIADPVKAKDLSAMPSVERATQEALENPIKCPPLSKLAKAGDKVVIAVGSIIRPGKFRQLILPSVIDKLYDLGIKHKFIRIIDAVGSQTPDSYDSWMDMFGKDILEKFKIFNHNPVKDCISLGKSEYGTPVHISKYVAKADLVIALDGIFPSNAGYTGGPKMFAVGTASLETINSTHISSCFYDDSSRIGRYKGNKFRDYLNAVGKKAEKESRSDKFFIINVVQNMKGDIAGIFSGDMIEAWGRACELADTQFKVEVPRVADIVLLGTPYPHGLTAFDLSSIMCFPEKMDPASIVRQGGVEIIAATLEDPLVEGTAEYKFVQIMRNAFDYHDVLRSGGEAERRCLEKGEIMPEGLSTAMRRARTLEYLDGNVLVVGAKQPGLARDILCRPVKSMKKALNIAFEMVGRDADIIVVPDIKEVIPQVKA